MAVPPRKGKPRRRAAGWSGRNCPSSLLGPRESFLGRGGVPRKGRGRFVCCPGMLGLGTCKRQWSCAARPERGGVAQGQGMASTPSRKTNTEILTFSDCYELPHGLVEVDLCKLLHGELPILQQIKRVMKKTQLRDVSRIAITTSATN